SSDSPPALAPDSRATSRMPLATALPATPRLPSSLNTPRNTQPPLSPEIRTIQPISCTSPRLPRVHELIPRLPALLSRALFASSLTEANPRVCSSSSIRTRGAHPAPWASLSLPRIAYFLLRIRTHSTRHSSWPMSRQSPPATPKQNPDETPLPTPMAVPF